MTRREFLAFVSGLPLLGDLLRMRGLFKRPRYAASLVTQPEGVVPGEPFHYATVCQQCPAGCGIIVSVIEGRAKKIEGNPAYPVNRGKTCARGQAGLQALYNPDRIRGPLKLVGARGSGHYQAISWDEAQSLLGKRLTELKRQGQAQQLALLTGSVKGQMARLINRFIKAFGSPHLFMYDFFDYAPVMAASEIAFGSPTLPDYDLGNCDYLLSFGADFLETWISPVRYGVAFGHMRQGRPGARSKMVHFEPRLSLTGANADEWFPLKPGTEGLLALGLAHVLVKGKLVRPVGPFTGWETYSPETVAKECEVPAETISRIAREFAAAKAGLAICGGVAASHTNGLFNLNAVNLLNLLKGNLGKSGGVSLGRPILPLMPEVKKDHLGLAGMVTLTELLKAGRIDTLLIYNTNPVYGTPSRLAFSAALEKAAFLVSFASFLDETASQADLILPDHTFLESWGDDVPPGVAGPVAGLRQPVVTPIYDTRSCGDVLLGLAKIIGEGMPGALPWESFTIMVQEAWKELLEKREGAGGAFQQAWAQALQRGGWWREEKAPAGAASKMPLTLKYEPASFQGSPEQYPFYFQPYPSLVLSEGRGANQPWLQERGDPMTSVAWGSWLEIHPATAKRLGLSEGDLAWVESPLGKLKTPVYIYPAVRPDVVAMPLGQGHTGYGRYAEKRGANPLPILAPVVQPATSTLAWAATRVKVYPAREKGRLIKMVTEGREIPSIEIVR